MVTHSELMKNADYEAIHSSLWGLLLKLLKIFAKIFAHVKKVFYICIVVTVGHCTKGVIKETTILNKD